MSKEEDEILDDEEADVVIGKSVIGQKRVGKTNYKFKTVFAKNSQAQKLEREMGVPAETRQDEAIDRLFDVYETTLLKEMILEYYNSKEIEDWSLDVIKKEIDKLNPFLKYQESIAGIRKQQRKELFRVRNQKEGVRRSLSDLYKTWVYPMKSANFNYVWRKVDVSQRLASMMVDYIKNNYDFVMTIVGEEGTMKSSFSLGLALELIKKGMNFDILYNMFFATTPVEYIINRIESTETQLFIFDEAQKQFDSRNFNKSEQKDLVQAIINSRARGHIFILNTPDVNAIDVRFRDRRVRAILNLLDGQYGIYMHRHSVGAKRDPFMLKAFEHKLNSIRYFTAEKIIEKARLLPTCYLVFKMTNYPVNEEIYNFYKKLKMRMNKVSRKVEDQVGTYEKNMIYDLLYIMMRNKELSEPIFKKLSTAYHNMPVDILRLNIKRIILPYVEKMRRRARKSKANKLKLFDDEVYVNEADERGMLNLYDNKESPQEYQQE